MRIAIDISQMVHEGTGVARYVEEMTKQIVALGEKHEIILFGASMRKRNALERFIVQLKAINPHIQSIILPLPPTGMDILWNILHIIPIEWIIGNVDVVWSSDWTQPPLRHAIGVTTIHDVSFLRFPESFDKGIISTHKKRLQWAKKECSLFFCDSEATKQDAMSYLKIPSSKLQVIYPGYSI